MCPEESVLSAYFDGELRPHWTRLMDEHLDTCESCRQKVKQMAMTSEMLGDLPEPDIQYLQRQSWIHIRNRYLWSQGTSIWRKGFHVPVPVALGSVLVILALSLVIAFSAKKEKPFDPFNQVTHVQIAVNEMTSFEEIVEYLNAREKGFEFVFRLPSNAQLHVGDSEPKLIRAADYHRGRE